jgi:ADP-dependent NAD(P)H-hydrate dehydratase / NAD(P)H-hydrate epimerase
MRYAYPVTTVRKAEQALMARLPDGALMQRAAAGLAATCARLLGSDAGTGARPGPGGVYGARVVVLAGSGDNGGDALYAGARLARRGAVVRAVSAGSRIHDGGAAALRAAGGRIAGADDPAVPALIRRADLIMDGMLGIGGHGGLREPYSALAGRAASAAATVVAVDLPSGIDADTGTVEGPAVAADVTVTVGTYKPGLLIDPGASHAGVTELVDIGLGPDLAAAAGPAGGGAAGDGAAGDGAGDGAADGAAGEGGGPVRALQAADLGELLPHPTAESDKYRRGVVGVLAGSSRFSGAAALSVGGAVRGGAGMVRFVSSEQVADVVRQLWPEVVITVAGHLPGADPQETARETLKSAGRVQAWTAGPGMGTGEDSKRLLAAVLETSVPALVDADGLTIAASDRSLLRRDAQTLITPHAGELGRLLGADPREIEARRLEHARRASAELGVTVLLKGSTTVIAAPGGETWVNATGTPWLATAGSGDVLSGLGGAFLAGGLEPAAAGAAAAYLHGVAARLAAEGGAGFAPGSAGVDVDGAGAPIAAFDLVRSLPAAFRAVATRGNVSV